MSLVNKGLQFKSKCLIMTFSALAMILPSYSVLAKNCPKVRYHCVKTYDYSHCPKKCERPAKRYNYSSYGNCPCFSSAGQLQAALGNNPPPNVCRSGKSYSLLTGGTLTFTSQEYGNVFSCYFQNINRKTKNEVVKYGSQRQVLDMHLACDAVIREFARGNDIKCNK